LKRKEQEAGDDLFVGGRLAAKRQKAGITIEKAAKDTRIPVARLLQIEADDFSSFAHPTYARMFLVDYANYLRVPLDEIRPALPGSQKLGSGDNKYLDVLLATPGFLQGEQFKSVRRLLIAIGAAIGVLLLIAVGIYSWRTWKKFERVKPAAIPAATPAPLPPVLFEPLEPTPQPSPIPTATPTPTPTATPTPSPSPSPAVSPTPFRLPPFQPSPRPRTTPSRPQ
jgi:cytoskeletal protein RodZ